VHATNRSGIGYQIAYAIRNPDGIAGYARRRSGDTLLWGGARPPRSY
jgi:hypothetical protein